ncbi:hypothetical protein L210DRAFT_983039 [Boletus edulis BED1]|uniref:Dehydrogenase E1 component domain-containing protein n=1 Tax=Boletus edulis BED1 TaxID=1328754 RepID=A0AAD4G9A3_BOLED|nr:hypothetical protein L210DRAFT_983039 [Boletus edulis BED1]
MSADTTQLHDASTDKSQPFTVKLHEDSFCTYKCDPPSLEVQAQRTNSSKCTRTCRQCVAWKWHQTPSTKPNSSVVSAISPLSRHEAVSVGLEYGIKPEDCVITEPTGVIPLRLCMADSVSHGKGGSMHIFTPSFFGGNSIVSAQVPVSASLAFAQKYLGHKTTTFAMYGDETCLRNA